MRRSHWVRKGQPADELGAYTQKTDPPELSLTRLR